MNILLCALGLGLLGSHDDGDSDWPQYGGPTRTGKTELNGVDFQWSAEGPRILWRTPVGPGYGGASVHDGEVFLLDREVGEVDVLRVLELETGEPIWDAVYEAGGRLNYPGSRTVPTVTADHVYTCGGMGRVACFDRADRSELWSVDLVEDYGGILPGYGWSCSPLLVDDLVIVSALGEEVGLVAFDRFTGDEIWITEPVGTTHSTPVLVDLLGIPQILFVSAFRQQGGSLDAAGTLTISSYDPASGEQLFQLETVGSLYPIPGPVQVDQDRLFVTGGYRGGSSLLRLAQSGDDFELEELFHIERGSQIHNPIVHGGHLYMLVNENWNDARNLRKEGGLLCLGLDGKERWRTGAEPNFGRGNALLAGDHLLVQDGYNGTLRVVRATPEGYQQVAEANLFGIDDRRDHQMWAPMALAGRHLLIRSQEELLCVGL